MTTKVNKTAQVIASLMREDTGKHFLDSGDHYGRNWQHNQIRQFENEPHATLSFKWDYIDYTYNLYHWLNERLEFNPTWDRKLQRYAKRKDMEREPWLVVMESFMDHLKEKGHEVSGLYGDGEPMTINTYNHESLLSQIIQFVYATVDNEVLILLQVHGGCDARGGYTQARVFNPSGYGEEYILFDQDASIYCSKNNDHYWSTDDGYNWYFQGSSCGTKLNDYEFKPITLKKSWKKGFLCYNENKDIGYCPLCGGTLEP